MINAGYAALSAQITFQKRLDTIANNVANSSTVGFRAEQVRFTTVNSSEAQPQTSFAATGETYLTTTSGDIVRTDNPLDVAVDGEAWIAVQTSAGRAFTKDGRLQITATGELRTITGHSVLDPGGSPLLLVPADGPPVIGHDGSITQAGRAVGAIGLFAIERGARLERGPDVTITTTGEATPLVDNPAAGLRQGYIERSNVKPVMEMSKLIFDQRMFEAVTSAIGDVEQARQSAMRILGGSA
jgi:flagellar basal-body rod protein FlgF